MRIALAGQTYHQAVNGPGVFARRLCEGLVARGHEVLVLTPSDRSRRYETELGGVRVSGITAVPFAKRQGVFVTPAPRRQVERALRSFAPDVVNLQDHYPLSRGVLRAARRLGLPVVGTNHFLPDNLVAQVPAFSPMKRGVDRVMWALLFAVLQRVDVVTVPTETAARILRARGLQIPVRAISCGVEAARFQVGLPRDEVRSRFGFDERPLVLYVGRLDRDKSVDVLLRAFARLELREAQLGVVGTGRYAKELEALASSLGLEGRVRFTGRVAHEELCALLRSADLFGMPSAVELQSIATLEAMTCGLPVIAADALALPELVKEDATGTLFRPGDPEDCAEAVRRMLRRREVWPRMVTACRAVAAQHELERTLERYEALYASLCERVEPVAAGEAAL